MTEFPITTANSLPEGIAAGPDGALWFVERGANKIGRITTAGVITNEIPIPTASSYSEFIAAGPDSSLWFTERDANKIGRISISPPYTVAEFTVPTASSGPQGITPGPDNALWFTESFGDQIGRINAAGPLPAKANDRSPPGGFTEYAIPSPAALPRAITLGQDGSLWFTEDNGNAIGRITASGAVTEYPVTTPSSSPTGIASFGGRVWFTENLADQIGHTSAGPAAPSGAAAVAHNASATVSWTAPARDGGSAITGYTVTPFIGTTAQAPTPTGSAGTSLTVTGLTNGTTYTFRVAATNTVGTGPASAASNPATPGATPPGPPTAVTAVAGNGQVSLSWQAPADDGGSAITGYRVTPYIASVAQTAAVFNSTATSETLGGLTNETAYTFTVAAANAVGTGPASQPSSPVTPTTRAPAQAGGGTPGSRGGGGSSPAPSPPARGAVTKVAAINPATGSAPSSAPGAASTTEGAEPAAAAGTSIANSPSTRAGRSSTVARRPILSPASARQPDSWPRRMFAALAAGAGGLLSLLF
jgi:streptogramin lyase